MNPLLARPSGRGVSMRGTAMQIPSAPSLHVRWLDLCLFPLVAACAPAPSPSSVTPTASGPAQRAAITAYHGLTSTVFAVAWSPDGTRIVSGGNDNTIQVWNATTGQRLVTYTGHLGSVWAVAWSPDGRRIASGGNDSTVQVWDGASAHRLLTFTRHTAPVRGVAWSPDGTRIASASQDGTVQVWDAKSGRHVLIYRCQTAPIWAVAWSPDGVCLASATGNSSDEQQRETMQVWNATTGHLFISYPVPSSAGEASGTFTLAWSPNGARIASGGADTVVHLWSVPLCMP